MKKRKIHDDYFQGRMNEEANRPMIALVWSKNGLINPASFEEEAELVESRNHLISFESTEKFVNPLLEKSLTHDLIDIILNYINSNHLVEERISMKRNKLPICCACEYEVPIIKMDDDAHGRKGINCSLCGMICCFFCWTEGGLVWNSRFRPMIIAKSINSADSNLHLNFVDNRYCPVCMAGIKPFPINEE